jgi:predicted TPR repeat methyltransferase
VKICFPDGTCVTASPISSRLENNPDRDFGLYLDAAWAPTWDAELVDWPDYGLPSEPEETARQIAAAFRRAKSGELVEIGCIGGLGRTGTVLACMAILAGVQADQAVAWVRDHYDSRAVETAEQSAWVLWFGGDVQTAL